MDVASDKDRTVFVMIGVMAVALFVLAGATIAGAGYFRKTLTETRDLYAKHISEREYALEQWKGRFDGLNQRLFETVKEYEKTLAAKTAEIDQLKAETSRQKTVIDTLKESVGRGM
ncbi:MAG: hypothetical protein HQL30_10190 [Candidatus Omnitrophica bacterium]|nr:hypothetical protein [Candidatus Omnitrophota bacterium]